MSKKMKNYFRTILSQKHLKRKNRNSNIREFSKAVEDHLKDLTKKDNNDNKKVTVKEREQEMIEVNKLLMVAIQEKQEKSSMLIYLLFF